MRTLFALCALITLGFTFKPVIAQPPPPSGDERPRRPPPMSPEEREKIRVRLGITEKQQNQLEQSFFETMDKRGELGKRLRQLFEAREKLYETYEIDRAKEKTIRNEISNIQNQFLTLHLESEEKVRRILNKEQFARFKDWREEHKREWQSRSKRWKEKGTSSP